MRVLIALSRLVNRFVYKEPCMFCTSLYWHKSKWVPVFNRIFFWHKDHCHRCFTYDLVHSEKFYQLVLKAMKNHKG